MSTSPLLHACINNNLKVADMLIKRGAQWNAKSTAGKTPLEQAIEEQRGDMIRLLNVRTPTLYPWRSVLHPNGASTIVRHCVCRATERS
jgi:ankyrin repeat protein